MSIYQIRMVPLKHSTRNWHITKFFSEQFCRYISLSRTSHKYTHPSMRKLKWEKLHFTTLNYSPNYNLQYKLLECMVSTLNYKSCYTLHSAINFFCYLRQHHVQKLNCTFSHFTTLKYIFTYTFILYLDFSFKIIAKLTVICKV